MFSRIAGLKAIALAMVIGGNAYAGPVIYGTYYDESATNSCSASFSCSLDFSQLPSDKLLMVSQVSCKITSLSAPVVIVTLNISATSGGQSLPRNYPLSFPASALSNTAYFTNVQQNIHFLLGQGRFPSILVEANLSTQIVVRCTIVGDLVTPIQ
jgi:hypothetical protein